VTGGFDPGRFTAAPLQTQGVIRFPGSPDPVFARITDHAAMTGWVPLLKTVQVSHPKPLPPGQSMAGTARMLAFRGGVTVREEVVYWDQPCCYAYTTEGKYWPLRDYVGFMGVQAATGGGGTFVSGQGVGALMGGVFGEWLPEPLRLVWLVYLAALIVVLVLLLLLPNDTRRHEPGWLYPTRLAVPSSMRALFIAYAVGAFAMSAVVGLYSSLTPSFLHTLLGLSSLALAGSVTFVLMLASVLAQIVCRSWNSRKAGVSGLLIVTAGIIVVTAAAAVSSLALLLAGSGIAGAGQGLAFMGLLAGVNGAAPDDQRGEVVSAFYVATWLGAALPVLAVGFAAPGIGLLRAAWIFTAVIAVISLGATAGLLKLKHTTVGAWVQPAGRLKSGGC